MVTANVFSWKKLFYFCLGLFVASAFCMKWLEPDFVSQGKKFSIMDVELFLNREELQLLFASLDDKTRTVLNYHLHFDFFFMAGVFPGIASMCMLARARINDTKRSLKSLLFITAALQLLAWGFDIYENTHLIKWLKDPSLIDDLDLFHLVVRMKFILAFLGVIMALTGFILSKKRSTVNS